MPYTFLTIVVHYFTDQQVPFKVQFEDTDTFLYFILSSQLRQPGICIAHLIVQLNLHLADSTQLGDPTDHG